MSARSSLRRRWTRAFSAVFLALFIGGAASVTGTVLLVNSFAASGKNLEDESAYIAQLRAQIVPYAVAAATPGEAGIQTTLALALRADFARGDGVLDTPTERASLQQAANGWIAADDALKVIDATSPASRVIADAGAVVSADLPAVLAALDATAALSRAESRADVRRNGNVEAGTIAGWIAAFLLAMSLLVRLARRLSTEVLEPVSHLRSSANRLAAGDLQHRVTVERDDEIGELARSFNAMADAVAGTQSSLTAQAHHDSLTGLMNRGGFHTRVEAMLAGEDRRAGLQALLFIDLDDFKDVNDERGHAAGDALLRVVASRLSEVVRPGDVVARLGGDEFAILLDGIPDGEAASQLAARAVASLGLPVDIGGDLVRVSASVGIALRVEDSDVDVLMREADIAMYSAKGRGKSRFVFYDASLHHAAVDERALRAELERAITDDELVLDYQPVVDLRSGELMGVEALVRWQHPTRGLLPPSEFIALAEESGAIGRIGSWVLRSATQQLKSWQRRYGRPELSVSVNVSVRELEAPGFAQQVTEHLTDIGLDPGCLTVEITESVLADPLRGSASALAALRAFGVRIALDDFGTGYASFGYLRELPIDIIKIDRSFISGQHAAGSGHALLEGMVTLGQRLGLDVIPEGIEQTEELERVRALGCVTGQGFLFSHPVRPGAIEHMLATPVPVFPSEIVGTVLARVALGVPAPRGG